MDTDTEGDLDLEVMSDPSEEDMRAILDYLHQLQNQRSINRYVLPAILAMGTIGNMVSCIVLCKLMHKLRYSYCYLSTAAVLQMFILWIRCGNELIISIMDFDIAKHLMDKYATVCKVYPTLTNFLEHMSVWLVVCVAIEGALIARDPRAIIKTCNLKRVKSVMSLLIVLLICPSVHFFWTYEIIDLRKYNLPQSCTYGKYGKGHYMTEAFVTVVWPIVDMLIKLFLPYTFILVCLFVMVSHPVKKNTKCHSGNGSSQSLIMTSLCENRRIMLAVCVAYLVLCLPYTVFTAYKSGKDWTQPPEAAISYDHSSVEAKEDLALTITEIMVHTFRSTQIFIYLAFSVKFRKICRNFMTWCCRRGLCQKPAKKPKPKVDIPQQQTASIEEPGIITNSAACCSTAAEESEV